jgi:hypothetical protein
MPLDRTTTSWLACRAIVVFRIFQVVRDRSLADIEVHEIQVGNWWIQILTHLVSTYLYTRQYNCPALLAAVS